MRLKGSIGDVNVAIIPRRGQCSGFVIGAEVVTYEFENPDVILLRIVQRKSDPEYGTKGDESPSAKHLADPVGSSTQGPEHAPGASQENSASQEVPTQTTSRYSIASTPLDVSPKKRSRDDVDDISRKKRLSGGSSANDGASNIQSEASSSSDAVVGETQLALVPEAESRIALIEEPENRLTLHSYQRRICDHPDCTNFAVGKVDSERLCKRHGGGPRCSIVGCINASIGRVCDEFGLLGERCRKHKGGRQCNVIGCETTSFAKVQIPDRFGAPGPRCKRHGGGGRCNVLDCGNCSAGKVWSADCFGPAGYRCKAHGAGVLCQHPSGCSKLASGGKITAEDTGTMEYRCSGHGGGQRCDAENCINLSTGRVVEDDEWGPSGQKRCRRHGGGMRCSVAGCRTNSAGRATEEDEFGPPGRRCKKHSKEQCAVYGCTRWARIRVDDVDAAFQPSSLPGGRCRKHSVIECLEIQDID